MSSTSPAETLDVAQSSTAPAKRGTLLIVDDEDSPREAVMYVFKDDYHVLTASDGPSAIRLAQSKKIDVAILDIRMEGMSGLEVLERLKYVNPAIEVIMLSAFETTDLIRQALRLRACDYISKPFELANMRAAVANAMQRHTLEGEIHNNAEQLERLLKDLQDQKIEEQMAQTRGDIYASIIHDINGPLTVISGFVQLLNQRLGNATRLETDTVELMRDWLKTITRQVTNCIEISRRYLNLMRRQPGEAPKVGVNQLLVDLGHLLRAHPSRQNHKFEIHPLPSDLAVRMNGTDLIQVLLNLTVNAFQCAPQPHSVSIESSVLPQAADLAGFKDGPQDRFLNIESFSNAPPLVVLAVSDDGPGIPPEVLPKIFQPYFSTKGPRQGTGLGLAIVQRLVKEGGGALQVHTEPGHGTTFRVYLSAVPLPQPVPA